MFSLSPSVNVSEIDLTTVVPTVATTVGALAGVFRWGPVNQRVLIDSEKTLAGTFGKPTNFNPETWFTGSNFLAYGNQLQVVRVANTTSNTVPCTSAIANTTALAANVELQTVLNLDALSSVTFDPATLYVAKYPGVLGNSLRVSVCDSVNAYGSTVSLVANSSVAANVSLTNITYTLGSNVATVTISANTTGVANPVAANVASHLNVNDYIQAGNSTIGFQPIQITGISSASVEALNANTSEYFSTLTINLSEAYSQPQNVSTQTIARNWEFYSLVNKTPKTSAYLSNLNLTTIDQLHIVVVDQNGLFSGVPGTVLEVWDSLSRGTDAKDISGSSIYYKTVLNYQSNYVWAASDRPGAASGLVSALINSTDNSPVSLSFVLGSDGADENTIDLGTILSGYDLFSNPEDVDVSLILQGKARGLTPAGSGPSGVASSGGNTYSTLANYLISNIAENRMDCIVCVSPAKEDVVNVTLPVPYIVNYRNNLNIDTSYGTMDSGYKYQYDKYNDVYRYIPLNGDIAGLIVRTDLTRDAWWSPAGFNRGQIKNVVKLAYNPSSKGDRDTLFKSDINPVVVFPGEGVILFGDKTLYGQPSAFDAIGVRRLFIVLEKAISTASKYTLFEFNDSFTQAQFVAMVTPFLRDVQGKRGIYDFQVVCDGTNNTPDVVDGNQFVGDIYIKPARSIRYIQLNFVAVRSGVAFSEIVGSFGG